VADRRLGRLAWNARRFGLTPAKLQRRLLDHRAPIVVSNSLPKAGTHLLERALCLHPRLYRSLRRTLHDRRVPAMGDLDRVVPRLRPGEVLVTHLSHDPVRERVVSEEHVRSLFLVRDPRDLVVSQAHYVAGWDAHPHHETLASTDDLQERYRRIITGDAERSMPSLRLRLESYAGWLTSPALLVRYEELIGAAGGGDSGRQTAVIRQLFDHIGLPMTEAELAALAAATFSDASPTFRKGSIGQWQQQFDERTLEMFEQTVGDLMPAYGYGAHAVPPDET
jgi:sulfotransferase 6B1